MLSRDEYLGDPVVGFFPDISPANYFLHLSGAKPFYKYAFTPDQYDRVASKLNSSTTITIVLLGAALVPILLHNRIPGLRNLKTWKKRLPLALAFLSVPIGVSTYISIKAQNEIGANYQLRAKQFLEYRFTGDITRMNPNIKFYENL